MRRVAPDTPKREAPSGFEPVSCERVLPLNGKGNPALLCCINEAEGGGFFRRSVELILREAQHTWSCWTLEYSTLL